MIKYAASVNEINDFTGQYYTNCPFCEKLGKDPDTNRKLGITFSINKYHCFRCGSSGKAFDLFEDIMPRNEFYRGTLDRILFKPQQGPPDEINMIKELIDFDSISYKIEPVHQNAVLYLRNRGITMEHIEKYDIRIGKPDSVFRRRLLVPTYDQWHNCVYMVARDYMGNFQNKYKNPAESHKQNSVWNLNRAPDGSGTIIINEGVFSGIASERYVPEHTSTAIYGKYVSSYQAKLIGDKKPDRVILALDGDVSDKVLNTNRSLLLHYCPTVLLARLPDEEDPDSLEAGDYRRIIESASDRVISI